MSEQSAARMVDVGAKVVTEREAVAESSITMSPQACAQLIAGHPKGDALEAARIAGLFAVKRTPDLLPFCHPVAVSGAEVSVVAEPEQGRIGVVVTVRATDRTGVEMEALSGAAIAALCLYDAAKAYDRRAVIGDLRLVSKRGGRSGDHRA